MSQADFDRETHRLFKLASDDTYIATPEIEIHHSDSNTSIASEFSELVMLTISSPLFRVLTLIHFTNDEATRNYVANKISASKEEMTDDRFYDYIAELGNTLCGSLKRSLNTFIPSLGMSTPNRLGVDTMKYMLDQKAHFENFRHVEINGQTLFECGLYICNDVELTVEIPTNYGTSAAEVEETDCGELELF